MAMVEPNQRHDQSYFRSSMMPPESTVRILFVGDMHLGRLPSRVPPAALDQGGMNLRDIGPAGTWKRIVDAAIEYKVDAVALAGDLVERDNAMFEAYGPLASGVRKLVEQGIIVAGVAGNHDTRVLPKLAAEIEGFHLLGPGGTWSTLPVSGDDGLSVNLVGWSFPSHHHTASPLHTPPPRPDGITLGLLHADLFDAGSRYAPVKSADLQSVGYRGWFLGHIHKPDPILTDGTPFYLGSVTGLKPTETGCHGPVLVQVDRGGQIEARRLPLATLRWEERDLDCSGLPDPAIDLAAHLLGELKDLYETLEDELDNTPALGMRITLTGEVDDPAALEHAARDFEDAVIKLADTVLFVQKITNRVTARIDLLQVAGRTDPPGLLARQILALENPRQSVPGIPDPAALVDDLVAAARRTIGKMDRETALAPLVGEDDDLSPERIREMLTLSGRLALAGLLAQPGKGETHHAAD